MTQSLAAREAIQQAGMKLHDQTIARLEAQLHAAKANRSEALHALGKTIRERHATVARVPHT